MKRKQYVLALGVKGASVAALFGVQVLVANSVTDRAEFGFYNYIISILNLASFVAIWGLDKYLVREVSVAVEEGRSHSVWAQIRSARRVIIVNLVLAGPILAGYLAWARPERFSWTLVAPVWLLMITICFARYSAAILRAMHRVIASEAALNLIRPIILGLGVLIFAYARGPLAAETLIVLTAAAFAASTFSTRQLSRQTVKPTTADAPKDQASATQLYQKCFPYLLIGVGLPLLSNLDVIMLGSLGSDDDVGLYAACVRLVTLTTVGLTAVNLLIAPRLPILHIQGKMGEMQALLRRNNIVILMLTIAPVLVLIFAGGLVLSIFGADYSSGESVLHVLLIGQVLNVFVGPVNLVCMMTHQHRIASILTVTACAIEAILCYILIPERGVHGAAWANAIALIFLSLTLAIVVFRKVRINPTLTNILISKGR